MALEELKLPDTFLEWCKKTNSVIKVVNEQIVPDKLTLLTTVSKDTLVNAINDVNKNKLDKEGGLINNSLQINGELDVKKSLRVGSDTPDSSIIMFFDPNDLKYKKLKWDSNKENLTFEDRNNTNNIIMSNMNVDLNKENIDIQNKRATSNIISSLKGKEAQIYYSQDEKRLYLFDGEKIGGYKLPISSDIGNSNLVKISDTDNTAQYLENKITVDKGLKITKLGVDNQYLQIQSNTFVSEMKMYAGVESSIPAGWIKCDGRALEREKYKDLFNKIGTLYGAGDGINTFNIPNMCGRVAIGQSDKYNIGKQGGEEMHTLNIAEMPEHKHIAPFSEAYGNDPWGLVSKGHYGSNGGVDFDNWWAYTSPAGGSQPHNNMQPYLSVFYIIFTGIY